MASRTEHPLVWFITGCSTGFGKALAERVLERGHKCVVTARNLAQVEPIVADHKGRGIAVPLDVTDYAQADRAVAAANEAFGHIDVLVNNAGWGYNCAVEEGEEEVVRRMFDANFFALAALIRKVLPGMRARGKGHVINLSSMGGLSGNPGTGYYCATKFAVEGLSQSLSKEAGPHGIKVTLIEPGPFRTDFQGRSMQRAKERVGAYADTVGARRAQQDKNLGKEPGDPVRAADAIIRVVEHPDPPLHLLLGANAVGRAREELTSFLRSIDEWEEVSRSADFPG
jgi:NAD(P)-dependent dehydrogenase (short-subunit alcohol dehydrogenase family)